MNFKKFFKYFIEEVIGRETREALCVGLAISSVVAAIILPLLIAVEFFSGSFFGCAIMFGLYFLEFLAIFLVKSYQRLKIKK